MLEFLQQNLSTIIISAILLVLFVLAIRRVMKTKGCECGGGECSGCCSHCHDTHDHKAI